MSTLIDQAQVVPYLLRHVLIDTLSIVDGDLEVHEAAHRNANYRVVSEKGRCYLLKQGLDEERRSSIAHEAEVYELLHSATGNGRLRAYLPRLAFYDPPEGILVIESWPDAQDLMQYHQRCGRVPVSTAAALGDALALLHKTHRVDDANTHAYQGFSGSPPWTLGLHRPDLNLYTHISNANVRLASTVQRFPEFTELLDALASEWQPECLIHGDVRWSNCVVISPGGNRGKKLKLVDWEFASIGDPFWDVGCAFAQHLTLWLLSTPNSGHQAPDTLLHLARFPLERLQPAIRGFWLAYVRRTGLNSTTYGSELDRALRYCAARLVQTAYEEGQPRHYISENAVRLLQLSFNILKHPREAAVHLLGLPMTVE